MIILSERQIVLLHDHLIHETGGTPGLRDEALLQSALAAPFQSFSGTDVFPSLQQKAARLAYGLVSNHPFIDGNKRIGAHAMLVFLELNGIVLEYSQNELSDLFLSVAASRTMKISCVGCCFMNRMIDTIIERVPRTAYTVRSWV